VYIGAKYYSKLDDVKWSRKMFGVSLILLLAMCAMIAIGGFLP
jgi:heme O synthase-like polyprenyltransferase